MTSFFGGRIGRYATSQISETLRNLILGKLRQGEGVTQIRTTLRTITDAKGQQVFRFSNQAITDIRREIVKIDAAAPRVKHLGSYQRPGPATLIKVGASYATRYRYHGIAHLKGPDGFSEDVPVMFGDNALLTGDEIRARLRDIGEQVAEKGGTGRGKQGYGEDVELDRVTIVSILESGA